MTTDPFEITKLGDWKTIEQRETQARKARKTQRRGVGAAALGAATLAAGGPNAVAHAVNHTVRAPAAGYKVYRGFGMSRPAAARTAAEFGGRALKAAPPAAKVAVGAGALIAGGLAGAAQGHAREKYHQSKINQRRRLNRKGSTMAKAADPFEIHKQSVARGLAMAAGKAPKPPLTAKTSKKVVTAMAKPTKVFGRDVSAGRVAGVKANSAAEALRASMKPKVFGKAADPFEVAKRKERQPSSGGASAGRLATGAVFAGVHGAVAGRKGRKLRAVGHEVGGAVVGSVVPGPGSLVGAAVGTNIANKKGYYKKEAHPAAFGKAADPFELSKARCSCNKPCPKCKDCACGKDGD